MKICINERQWVTMGTFAFSTLLLVMAWNDHRLWEVKLFEVITQAVVLTGLLNLVLAFHFSANKGDEAKSANTGAAFRAIEATATGHAPSTGPTGSHDDPLHVAGADANSEEPPVEVREEEK